MRLTIRCLLAALVGLAVFVPTVGHAEKATFSDPGADVQLLNFAEDDDGDELPPAEPSETTVSDMRRIALNHAGERIEVKVRLAEVTRRGVSGYIFVFAGSNGRRLEATVDNESKRRGEVYLERPGRGGVTQRCVDSARHRIDYRENTVSLSFARHCLASPTRVRVAVLAAWIREQGNRTTTAYDIAFRDGGRADRRWGFSGAVRHTR